MACMHLTVNFMPCNLVDSYLIIYLWNPISILVAVQCISVFSMHCSLCCDLGVKTKNRSGKYKVSR